MYQDGYRGKIESANQIAECCTAGSPQRDMPEVERALNGLREVVQRYDHVAGKLAEKLNCVVVPASPVGRNEKAEREYQTVLASEVNEVRCRLRDITDGLESLYQRIEL